MKKTSNTLEILRWLLIRGIELVFVMIGVLGIFSVPEDNDPHWFMVMLISKTAGFVGFYIWYRIDKAAFPQDWADDKLDEA